MSGPAGQASMMPPPPPSAVDQQGPTAAAPPAAPTADPPAAHAADILAHVSPEDQQSVIRLFEENFVRCAGQKPSAAEKTCGCTLDKAPPHFCRWKDLNEIIKNHSHGLSMRVALKGKPATVFEILRRHHVEVLESKIKLVTRDER